MMAREVIDADTASSSAVLIEDAFSSSSPSPAPTPIATPTTKGTPREQQQPSPSPSPSPSSPNTKTDPPLCKHWARSKSCLYHSKGKCKFYHPLEYEIPPPPKQQQQSRQSRQTDLSHRHRSAGGRLQTRNDARVAILRAFLADTMGTDLSSYNVLDVAGGKGELAFQLLNLNNVLSCHVIDPRPLSLVRFQKRLSRGFYHRSQGILQTDVVRPLSDPERPVDQLQCFFSSELWEFDKNDNDNDDESKRNRNDDDGKKDEESKNDNGDSSNSNSSSNNNKTIGNYQNQRTKFFENCYKARGWVWPPVGGSNEHASCGKNYNDRDDVLPKKSTSRAKEQTPATITDTDESSGTDPSRDNNRETTIDDAFAALTTTTSSVGNIAFDHASAIVKQADLIVGMHPDQAVDAIIDAALYQNISFFVIPCCTYSREFPNRRIAVRVETTDHDETKPDKANTSNSPSETTATAPSTGFEGARFRTKLVTTYTELITYLQAKSPDIRRHVLPFEGRNICLYRVVAPQDQGNQ